MSSEAEVQRILDRAEDLHHESAELVASAELYAAQAKVQATIAVGFAILAVISAAGAALFMVLT